MKRTHIALLILLFVLAGIGAGYGCFHLIARDRGVQNASGRIAGCCAPTEARK